MATNSIGRTLSPENDVLTFVLDAYKQGCVDRSNAIGMLKQILAARAIGDHLKIRELSKKSSLERWAMDRRAFTPALALAAGKLPQSMRLSRSQN
jgi:hypothetical protein